MQVAVGAVVGGREIDTTGLDVDNFGRVDGLEVIGFGVAVGVAGGSGIAHIDVHASAGGISHIGEVGGDFAAIVGSVDAEVHVVVQDNDMVGGVPFEAVAVEVGLGVDVGISLKGGGEGAARKVVFLA